MQGQPNGMRRNKKVFDRISNEMASRVFCGHPCYAGSYQPIGHGRRGDGCSVSQAPCDVVSLRQPRWKHGHGAHDVEIGDGTANTITAAISSGLQTRQLDVTKMSTLSADGVLPSHAGTRLPAFQCWQNWIRHLTHCTNTTSTVLCTMLIFARCRQQWRAFVDKKQNTTDGCHKNRRFLL